MYARIRLAFGLAVLAVGCQERQLSSPALGPHACAELLSRTDFDVSVMDAERDNPDWQLEQFDFDEDPYRMDAIRRILDATDPDLTRFRDAGGKMITYHGWSDTALNPLMVVNYYEDVLSETPETADFYRLFMVPGMFHCAGGRGINRVDAFPGLVEWVETGVAPDRLVGERVDRGRWRSGAGQFG